jgi:hypothetical protein
MFPSLSDQYNLCSGKLAQVTERNNLALFKYSRKVMYDQLWQEYPDTMECRGHVYDISTGKIVQAAPRKSFNYLENGWWKDVPLHTKVRIEKKYNGYLACATIFNDELLVTTTGSFDSDYQRLAENMIRKSEHFIELSPNYSTHFEICAEFDPHIVHEEIGVKLLGYRWKHNGDFLPAITEGCEYTTLGDATERVNSVRHEGFMVHHRQGGGITKLKSPYYVGKKKLMRISGDNWQKLREHPYSWVEYNLPMMWHNIALHIGFDLNSSFFEMNEQQRRWYLEQMEVEYEL